MDVLTQKQRSQNMRSIKAANTKPEILLRQALWKNGFRYRKNYKVLPGKPDVVISRYRIAIFVDSEFFHGKDWDSTDGSYPSKKYCNLREQILHGHNSQFWLNKIQRNLKHDREVDALLTGLGWTVLRFWSRDVIRHTDECIRCIKETIFEQKINADF